MTDYLSASYADALPRYTVTDINHYIKLSIDGDPVLHSVIICGEVSNYSCHYKTGHCYFTLKDEKSQLKAVMFASDAAKLRFQPKDGMKVVACGRIAVYEAGGSYQLYVKTLKPDGDGDLALAFEQLKKKLGEEGLFDPAKKKKLPEFPKKIGVVTSPTGAAVQDIFKILARRYPLAEIVFAPVSVQGAKAAWEIKEAVEKFSALNNVDVLIVGRGGGSAEDLWCFNDELLARAIAACPIPVISAVGHETDFTICDFVADVRAATPSAAAELATPDIEDLKFAAADLTERLYGSYKRYLTAQKSALSVILAKRDFNHPGHFFDNEKHQLALYSERLSALRQGFISGKRHELEGNINLLSSLNPLSVLLRGYSAVEKEGKFTAVTDEIEVGDDITIRMADGSLSCEVKEKWKN